VTVRNNNKWSKNIDEKPHRRGKFCTDGKFNVTPRPGGNLLLHDRRIEWSHSAVTTAALTGNAIE